MTDNIKSGLIQGVILLVCSTAISITQEAVKGDAARDTTNAILLTKIESIEKTVSKMSDYQDATSDKLSDQQVQIATLWANLEQLRRKAPPDG